jgi:hypothetical protein
MSEDPDGFAHDEETYAKSIAPDGVEAGERLEDPWQLLIGDTDACVEHVDSDALSYVTTAKEYPTSRSGVLDRVTHQIAEYGTEKQVMAHRGCGRRDHPNLDSLSRGDLLACTACLSEQWLDGDGRERHLLALLVEKKRAKKLIELFGHTVNAVLAQLQQAQLGFRANADTQALMDALNDLDRLPQVVSRDG